MLLLLSGCSYIPTLPYKIDIQQGNVVTEEMVEKLKPGMSRSQVRFVLGTPLITDVFHADRWDYFYYFAHVDLYLRSVSLLLFLMMISFLILKVILHFLPASDDLLPIAPSLEENRQPFIEEEHEDDVKPNITAPVNPL